eukprot:GHVO01056817.1.p1 GENE.GHVO01056817.1~~GHVO01056817.1.p1  ORF type:complete len:223 (+),score=28.87 GHVO01056817.1:139-807(+)
MNAKKRKKLPPPTELLSGTCGPVDDCSKHEGRKRQRPHIDGDYAVCVYISVPSDVNAKGCVDETRDIMANQLELNDVLSADMNKPPGLHISLCEGFVVRYHYIKPLLEVIKGSIKGVKKFSIPFSKKILLYGNSDHSRWFGVRLPSTLPYGLRHMINTVQVNTRGFGLNVPDLEFSPHISFAWTTSPPKVPDGSYLCQSELTVDVNDVHVLVGQRVYRIELE